MAKVVKSEIAGNVWKVVVKDGATVRAGEEIVILESMKMEIPVESPAAGVCRLSVTEGQAIAEGDVIATIE